WDRITHTISAEGPMYLSHLPAPRASLLLRMAGAAGAVLLAVFLVWGAPAGAVPSEPPARRVEPELVQLDHTVFTVKQGAPSDIRSMTQTADGFVWIASSSGLYRFDGSHFDSSVSDRLASPSVNALLAESGDLWVGYTFGGVSLLRDRRVIDFDATGLRGGVK